MAEGVTNCPAPLWESGLTTALLRHSLPSEVFMESWHHLDAPGQYWATDLLLVSSSKDCLAASSPEVIGVEGALPYSPGWIPWHDCCYPCHAKECWCLLTPSPTPQEQRSSRSTLTPFSLVVIGGFCSCWAAQTSQNTGVKGRFQIKKHKQNRKLPLERH